MKTFDLNGFAKWAVLVTLALMVTLCAAPAAAQDGGWTHWGGNAASTRYMPFDQIDASNFEDLEVAWVWRGDNFGPMSTTSCARPRSMPTASFFLWRASAARSWLWTR